MRFFDSENDIIIAYDKETKWLSFTTSNSGNSWKVEPVNDNDLGNCYLSKDESFLTIKTFSGNRIILIKQKGVI